MGKLLRRLRYWIHQGQIEADLAEELEFHRSLKQKHLEELGLASAEAESASRRALGNVLLAREDARAVWIWPWLESVWRDGLYALRNLRRQPGFAIVALSALALAIGLNTSLFTVFNIVALRPWPVKDPERVVTVFSRMMKGQVVGGFSLAEYRYFAEHARSFNGMVAMRPAAVSFGFEEFGKRTRGFFVSGNYLRVLGVEMEQGRGFLPEEDLVDSPQPVAVLSYSLWSSRFGGDAGIVGRQVRINEIPFTIVGVASRDFTGTEPGNENLWMPLSAMPLLQPEDASIRHILRRPDYCCSGIAGRLSPGVTKEAARAELEVLSTQFRAQFALDKGGIVLGGTTFLARPNSKRAIIPVFTLMFLGVTLVLLLACANVGNLLLARAAARRREIAMRLALGAGRRRVVRQLMTESLVLALVAGALGLWLAYELPSLVFDLIGQSAPFRIAPDGTVLAYTLILATLACIAFGLAPALYATRCQMTEALKDQSRLSGTRLPLRSILLSLQVALSVVLLIAAGLLLRGVQRARTQDLGFSARNVAVVSFEFPARLSSQETTGAFFTQLSQELEKSAQFESFALTSREPLSNSRDFTGFRLSGESQDRDRSVNINLVSPGYFELLRIPIAAGRNFEPGDEGRNVVLINETMARRYWPHENAVGKTLVTGTTVREIVGVARNAYTRSLDEVEPILYYPFGADSSTKLLVSMKSASTSSAIAAIAARIDPKVRVQLEPLEENVKRWLAASRMGAAIAGIMGAFALGLAGIGLFGVFAYVVQQRTPEIGVRMALGARPAEVVRLVVGTSSRAVLIGLAVGFVISLAVSRMLQAYLFGVSPLDPLAYAGVAILLSVAGLLATFLPARRATRIDPLQALRHE